MRCSHISFLALFNKWMQMLILWGTSHGLFTTTGVRYLERIGPQVFRLKIFLRLWTKFSMEVKKRILTFYEQFDKIFDGLDNNTETMSVCQAGSSASGKKQSGKKWKFVDKDDPIYELLGTFCQNIDARLDDIARRIGYEYDIANARNELFSVVGNIAGLTLHEKLLVSKLLVKDTEDLELFFSLPDKVQVEFAKMKLVGSLWSILTSTMVAYPLLLSHEVLFCSMLLPTLFYVSQWLFCPDCALVNPFFLS